LERGLLPPVQFDIDCRNLGPLGDTKVLEIVVHHKNLGSAALVEMNIRVDILYIDARDEYHAAQDWSVGKYLFHAPDYRMGRLKFPGNLTKDVGYMRPQAAAQSSEKSRSKKQRPAREKRGICLLPHATFVQPGVDQVYTYVTVVPESTTYVLVWSSFEYAQFPSRLQGGILYLSRLLGLIQFSLQHIEEPHTAERVFKVG
jgi:hypothetical protein